MCKNLLPSAHRLRCAAAQAPSLLDRCFDTMPAANWQFSPYVSGSDLPEHDRPLIQRRLAELAFWRTVACPDLEPDWPDWMNAVRPFADVDATLHDLLPYAPRSAMAVFPLAGKEGRTPRLARIYLIDGTLPTDSRRHLDFPGLIPTSHAVLLSLPGTDDTPSLTGASWQLAAALACQAISEPQLRQTLGCDWICTGEVSPQNAILPVELGNKPDLAENSPRRWLLPTANQREWPTIPTQRPHEPERIAVTTLEDALTRVRQHGVLADMFKFPTQVDELHVLLGGSLAPAFAVAMQIFPAHLCIWHSQKTRGEAEYLRKLVHRCGLHVSLRELPSDNLVQIETILRKSLEQSAGRRRLVSMTGGNRLMGVGAMLAARATGVWLVYRDIDAPDDQLEVITFAEDATRTPRNGKTTGNNCPPPWRQQVNWPELYARKITAANKPPHDEPENKFWRTGAHP